VEDTINYIDIEEKEKVIRTLASSFSSGLAEALADDKQKTFTSCTRAEKTSLQALLKPATQATSAMEVRFEEGLAGNVLLLLRTNDLFRLGGYLSGGEAKIEESMPPELMEVCLEFFTRALEASNRIFRERHQIPLSTGRPELINPDGKPNSLQPMAPAYEGAYCLTFQLTAEPQLDSTIRMLLQGQVVISLMELLPGPGPTRQAAQPQTIADGEDEDMAELTVGSSDVSPVRPAKSVVRKPGSNLNMDLLLDVELPIVVCFGESEMQLKDVLRLGVGSVIDLDRSVNDPVSVIVNQKPIAKGEVVMVDGNYGVRIIEVESTAERIRSLG